MIKIGYIILAHQKPAQLLRLMKRLESASNHIFLHLDKRVDGQQFLSYPGMEQIQNLHHLKRFKSYWGSIGLVNATVAGMKEALENKCDYVILLSGSDYPIKSNSDIDEFLVTHSGKSFFTHYNMPAPHWLPDKEINRIRKYYFYLRGKLFEYPIHPLEKSIPRRALNYLLSLFLPKERLFPKNIQPHGGDQWFCITNSICQEILDFYKHRPEVMNFLRFSLIPDEIFLQTAVFNSSNDDTINAVVNDTIILINWKNRNNSSPACFEMADFDELCRSRKLFARKFDGDVTPQLFDKLDKELLYTSDSAN